MSKAEVVAVLGASDKPERYAYKALRMLLDHGHQVIPVHPSLASVDGFPVVPDLGSIPQPVDTLTIYVNPTVSLGMADDIIRLRPKRVIFNPGTESAELEALLRQAGIPTVTACTLVLLSTGQFS